jgi:hypothetical protein
LTEFSRHGALSRTSRNLRELTGLDSLRTQPQISVVQHLTVT